MITTTTTTTLAAAAETRERAHAPSGLIDVGRKRPLAHAPLLHGAQLTGQSITLHG